MRLAQVANLAAAGGCCCPGEHAASLMRR